MGVVETDHPPLTEDPVRRARLVRRSVIALSVIGIGGMIFGSIRDNNGIAITFGIVTAVAVGFLILLTAVVGRDAFTEPVDNEPVDPSGAGGERGPTGKHRGRRRSGRPRVDERVAADVEARVQRLVDAGADEHEVRQLVTRAIDLGRS